MPCPGWKTALASTIDAGAEGQAVCEKAASPGGRKGPSTTFQSLTRRLNNLNGRFGEFPVGSMNVSVCLQQLSLPDGHGCKLPSMKRAILTLTAMMSVALSQTDKAADTNLSVRLRSDKTSYSLRGDIHLEIIRENTGADRLLVCRQWGWGIRRTEVQVFDATGKEVHTDFMADELPPPPQLYDFVMLSPGDFIGTRLEEPAKPLVTKPGDYELVIKYTSYLSESYAREAMKMPNEPFWSRERGPVMSNRINLRVTE